MIGSLRNFAKTKLAGVLVFIIIIPFVFWGMGSMFNSGNTNNIAKINKTNVSTQDFIDYLNTSGVNRKTIQEKMNEGILEELLSTLVSTTLLDLEIQDFDIINELSTFVARKGSYEAEEGSHDDLAMCLVMFAWLSGQPYFKELTETDIRQKLYKEKMQAIEDELTPFGFVSDGLTEKSESFVDAEGDRWVVVDNRSW